MPEVISTLQHISLGEGRLEIICGPMFSGKTEELLRRVRRAQIAHQPTVIFKPATDTRYNKESVTSHDANAMPSVTVANSQEILNYLDSQERPVTVIAIDEVQFFDDAGSNQVPDQFGSGPFSGSFTVINN